MIRIFFDSPDDSYSPNAGMALQLKNQIGQDNFKLDGHLFASNTDPVAYSSTWNIRQELLDTAGKVVSSIVKDVPVTIPAGAVLKLSPLALGSIPMKGINTEKVSYRYRVCVKVGEVFLSDTETGVFFDGTNTVFNSPLVPYVAGGGGVVVIDASGAIAVEISKNDAEIAVLTVEIPKQQARSNLLKARNVALKAVPPVTAPV